MFDPKIIAEQSESFNEIIKKTVKTNLPKNKYSFPRSTSSFNVKDDDLKNFKLLYRQTGGDQTIGFGEIALYWLFNGKVSPYGDIDLIKGNDKIDVKSYGANSYMTLGKWKDNIKTRQLINVLFSCYNLMNIGKDGSFKSELGFNTAHIEEAIRANIQLHSDINNLKYKAPNIERIKDSLDHVVESFKKMSKTRGRKFIELNSANLDDIVKESVADLIYGLVHYKLFESPTGIGENGYIINVIKESNTVTGQIKVYRAKGLNKDSDPLHNNFRVTSGEIKIRPDILHHF